MCVCTAVLAPLQPLFDTNIARQDRAWEQLPRSGRGKLVVPTDSKRWGGGAGWEYLYLGGEGDAIVVLGVSRVFGPRLAHLPLRRYLGFLVPAVVVVSLGLWLVLGWKQRCGNQLWYRSSLSGSVISSSLGVSKTLTVELEIGRASCRERVF